MSLRAVLAFIALGATVAPSHAALCPDPGAVCSIQCYDYPYCTVWRACWITESGIGVCSPVRRGRTRAMGKRIGAMVDGPDDNMQPLRIVSRGLGLKAMQ